MNKRRIAALLTATLVFTSIFTDVSSVFAFENNLISEDLITEELIEESATENNSKADHDEPLIPEEQLTASELEGSIPAMDKEAIDVGNDGAAKPVAGSKTRVSENDIEYELDNVRGTATVVKWYGSGKVVVPSIIELPDNYEGKIDSSDTTRKVIAIAANAFAETNAHVLEEIELPDTLETVEGAAFRNCVKLQKVSFPGNMNKIGDLVFAGCTSLNEIHLPQKLTTMGNSIFSGCISLNSIEIPNDMDITTIKPTQTTGPFSGADNLTDIKFAAGTKKISDMLFAYCHSITEINLPSTVTTIGKYTFYGCQKLRKVTLPNIMTTIDEGAFGYCISLERIDLPTYLETLGTSAFLECKTLSECTIPDTVNIIGGTAFGNCVKMSKVTFKTGDTAGEKVGSIGTRAFYGCAALKEISIPNSMLGIGKEAFVGCTSLEKVAFETRFASLDSKISVGESAFAGCVSLNNLVLSDRISTLGKTAFWGCEKLTAVSMPDSIETVDTSCFENCATLSSVSLSKGLKAFGIAVFKNDKELASILIPKSLTSVATDNKPENGVFAGCDKLKRVEFEEGITKIPDNLFWGTKSIVVIDIPNTVTVIGNNSFRDCEILKYLTIPESVTDIGIAAFYNCFNLINPNNNISVIPSSVTTIGEYAFGNCIKLDSVKLSGAIERIGSNAFLACEGITEVHIPDGVSLGDYCFSDCTGLRTIHLPADLTTVPNGLFKGCIALTDVNLSKDNLTTIGEYAFNNCDKLITFNGTSGLDMSEFKKLSAIGKFAFQDCDSITVVALPAATTQMGDHAFDDCNSLSAISLGTGLSTIPQFAFSNLISLSEMTIPRNVTRIELNAFINDPKLKDIHIPKFTYIDDSTTAAAFSYFDRLVFHGTDPSPAKDYATYHHIDWVDEIVYVSSLKYAETELEVNVNTNVSPVLEILPVHYSVEVEYTSSNPDIFTVDGKGTIRGVAPGKATLTARALADKNGTYKTAKVEVTVRIPVTNMAIDPRALTLDIGDKKQLKHAVIPENATNKKVIWSSSDESVVYVDQKGVVYARSKGDATVSVKSEDNVNAVAQCAVKVTSDILPAPESWNKTLNKPVAVPGSSAIKTGTQVKLVCSETNANIYYTTDGNVPAADYRGRTGGSTRLYTGPIPILKNTTIKAFAICAGFKYSPVLEETYTVDDGWGDIDVSLRGLFGNDPDLIPGGVWFYFDGEDKYYDDSANTGISKEYTGEKIVLDGEINVFHGNSLLVPGRDYKVTYSNNINIAPVTDQNAPAFMIKGSGNYSDKKVFKFAIVTNTKPIEPGNVTDKDVVITGLLTKPVYIGNTLSAGDIGYDKVTLLYKGTALKKGDDYDIDMSNATAFGKFDVVFRFKGKYSGNIKKSISVQKYDIKKDQDKRITVKVDPSPITFSKAGAMPGVSVTYIGKQLKEGVDYKLTFSKNKAVTTKALVKVVGKGCFRGTKATVFEIIKAPVSNVKLVIDDVKYVEGQTANKYFVKASKVKLMQDGKSVKSSLEKLKDSDLKFFDATTQKEISSSEVLPNYTIIEVRATLKAKGNSPFTGTSETLGTYRIIPEDKNIKSATVTIKDSYFADGEELVPLKSSDIEVRLGNAVLPSSEYDIISVTKNRFVGTGKVTIAGRNEHGGTKTKTFKIRKKTL